MTLTLTTPEGFGWLPGFFYFGIGNLSQPCLSGAGAQGFAAIRRVRTSRSNWFFLFVCQRVPGLLPGLPTALKGKYALIPFLQKGACHPGTCALVLSGTIKYEGLILVILWDPFFHCGWIFSHGRWNFLAASPPVSVFTYIYDDCIGLAQQRFNLMNRNPGHLSGIICKRKCSLAHDQ
jgi:hypothetical protein